MRPFGVVRALVVGFLLGASLEPREGACLTGSVLAAPGSHASTSPRRRALLVGIDDYESQVPPPGIAPPPGRGFRNLHGAAGDAQLLGEVLVERYGFRRDDVVVLTDGAATRDAIEREFEDHLVGPSGPGDTVVFYFGGHGSQVENAASVEGDKLDETFVPADAGRGARDLRDKELRRWLNALLDRGARPTALLDSCHSGSGARGLPTALAPRALAPDPRAIHDPGPYGPLPQERGALILSAARAEGLAWETTDPSGTAHGAFTWALLQALRDSRPGEPAEETFQRLRARLHAETRLQEPVLEGTETVLLAPLFGSEAVLDRRRSVVAVERVEADGTVVLQGGWVHGLAAGSQLTFRPEVGPPQRLEVREVLGVGRSRARRMDPPEAGLSSGDLLEVTGWAAPPGRALGCWISSWPGEAAPLFDLATELSSQAARQGVVWVVEPLGESPTHVLRWRNGEWELVVPGEVPRPLGPRPRPVDVLGRVPRGGRFFLQLPLPEAMARNLEIGSGTPHDGILPTAKPEDAAVVLAGRWSAGAVEFAWIRPDCTAGSSSGLPTSTPWRPLAGVSPVFDSLRDDLYHLRKIHGWLALESPSAGDFGYRLELVAERDGRIPAAGSILRGGDRYHLGLRRRPGFDPARLRPRHLYVFAIDPLGNSSLLFGTRSDANFQPYGLDGSRRTAEAAPEAVRLDSEPLVRVAPPFGRDCYFLLTTDEPLPTPRILEYKGFRPRGPRGRSPLEELLSLAGGTSRGTERIVTPSGWSIEHWSFVSLEAGGI